MEQEEKEIFIKMLQNETILKDFSEKEIKATRLWLGMEDGTEHTLLEIGEKMGVTRERARQILTQTIRKLRHPSRQKLVK